MGNQVNYSKNFIIEPVAIILLFFVIVGSVITTTAFVMARDITINDNGEEIKIHTFSWQVEDVLMKEGIDLHPKDKIMPSLEENLTRVGEINIIRAYPVYIKVDGQEIEYWITEGKIGDVLKDLGIRLGQFDLVQPGMRIETETGMDIKITRIFKQEIIEDVVLSYREVKKDNPDMDKGFSRVVQQGKDGLRKDVIEIIYEDGKESMQGVIESTILQPRQDRIVQEGSNTLLAARGGQTVRFSRAMMVTATSYAPLDPEAVEGMDYSGNPNVTASGARAEVGTGSENDPYVIAVDPRVIPLGARVYIEGYGFARALDRGSAIRGNKIDILFASRSQALRFGRRSLKIYLLP